MKRISILAVVLVSLSLLISAAAASVITIENGQIDTIGGSASMNLTLDSAPAGLAGYDITIAVADPAVANITEFSLPSWASLTDNITLPSSQVRVAVSDLNDEIQPTTSPVSLGTLTLTGLQEGSTEIQVNVSRMNDDVGENLTASVESAIFTVSIPPTVGSVSVTSAPEGAAIALDGADSGSVTPFTFDNLVPGDHNVSVSLEGYNSASATVSVIAGETAPADFQLVSIPQTGSVSVTSTPEGAAIALDGADSGSITPFTFDSLVPGDHNVSVSLEGYNSASATVAVIAGETASADFQLVAIPQTGSVSVTSTPEGAAIALDGNDTGSVTPFTFDNLVPGDHNVTVSLEGYNSASSTVSVIAGETAPADFQLVAIPQTGSISVTSTPEGAAIALDGTDTASVTPITFDNLVPGDHNVTVSLEGYNSASSTVTVTAGETASADFQLVAIPQTGSVSVTSTPEGAAIALDGADTGNVTPFTFGNLVPGDHNVSVSLEGYNPASMAVTVIAGETAPADFQLVAIPQTGSISITSTPEGAAIALDGNDTGSVTPFTLGNLVPGDHTVAVSLEGYNPASMTVTVTAGETAPADFQLVAIPQTGSISVTSTPEGAAIALDGNDTGSVTPFTFGNLVPGDHTVAVTLEGYNSSSMSVTVIAGETALADFQLVAIPQTGSISLTSTPEGAAIALDGNDTGSVTPFTLGNLVPGDHRVAVTLEGYNSSSMSVTVIAGETAPADFPLVAIPQTGLISVTSVPEGAAIALDGNDTGSVTPFTLGNLVAGDHNVSVSLEGYNSASMSVTVIAGETAPADFQLVAIPQTGLISVTSVPEGAAIALDGADSGSFTPFAFDNLVPGDHTVAVTLEGYNSASATVTVIAGETAPVDFQLVAIPQTGSISVTSVPEGAAIALDGADSGSFTPFAFDNLVPGDHTVAVTLEGYNSASATVSVIAGETAPVDFQLVAIPQTGSISVTSTPEGAAIALDGADSGSVTPFTFDNLVPGDHTVAVSLEGYNSASATVTVIAGETAPVDFQLVAIPQTGSIAVTSSPEGAAIALDGADTGSVTPFTLDNLVPGNHTVAVSLAGYTPASQTVVVSTGSTSTANFILVPLVQQPKNQANLAITKTSSTTTAYVGDNVTWTITVTNFGPGDAKNILVKDDDGPQSKGMNKDEIRTPSAGDVNGNTWKISTLRSGDSATLTEVEVYNSPGTKTETATIQNSATKDPDNSNNAATASIIILAKPASSSETSVKVSNQHSQDTSIKSEPVSTVKETQKAQDSSDKGQSVKAVKENSQTAKNSSDKSVTGNAVKDTSKQTPAKSQKLTPATGNKK